MNAMAENYKTSIGADNVSCTISSVEYSPRDYRLEVNSTIYVKKGTSTHSDDVSQDINLLGQSIPDPLPFIILKNYGNITCDNESGKILYGSTLVNISNKFKGSSECCCL